MPIVSSDLKFQLSVTTGSAGNSVTSSPAASLGKYISTTAWDQGTLKNNLFADVTGAENAASGNKYKAVFVWNNHATLTLQNAQLYIDSQIAGGADATIGLDTTAVSNVGSSSAQAVTIANEDTAPAGVSFTTPNSASPLTIGDIGPGQVKAFWIKRHANNTAAFAGDGITVGIAGDTDA